MNATDLRGLLARLGACNEAVTWSDGKTLADVWQTCDRADWLLWLCGRMAGEDGWPTRQEIVLVACLCAERALKHFEAKYPADDRPRKAIEAARAWAQTAGADAVSLEEVRKARRAAAAAADAADAYAAAAAAAAYAAAAYAYAAAAAADAYAAAAAAAAAYAAADAAADARSAFGQVRDAEMKVMCEIVRANLKIRALENAA